ncbi:MAG: hypothetical protein V1668_03265 [Patescibacteria group bacterium]
MADRRVGFFYNPGSTSDEVCAAYVDEFLKTGKFIYRLKRQIPKGTTNKQRFELIAPLALDHDLFRPEDIVVIGTRGAILDGAQPGVTVIDDTVIKAITDGKVGTPHICNEAPRFGYILAQILNDQHQPTDRRERTVSAYFADPVSSIDPEYIPEATITGHPALRVKGYGHYLNLREVIRRYAADENTETEHVHAIIVHAGGGISVAAVRNGKIVAINNANEAGPFSDGRPGSLPTLEFANWVWQQFSNGKSLVDIQTFLLKQCGLFGLAGVNDFKEAVAKAEAGDTHVQEMLSAFYFHITEEIAKRLVVCDMRIEKDPALILTGGIAQSDAFLEGILRWTGNDAREHIRVYPGSFEMEALARQVFQAYLGEVPVNTYIPLS